MRYPERVRSRRVLAEDIWGYDFLGDSNVVEVTVSHIRQALEAAGEPRLIQTVRPGGYILRALDGGRIRRLPRTDRPGRRAPAQPSSGQSLHTSTVC